MASIRSSASPSNSPASQRLSRQMIMRRPALLHAARKSMRRLSDDAFLLYVQRVEAKELAGEGAAAFLTPKKLGSAVVRQRVRRRMREIFRREIPWRQQAVRWLWVAQSPAARLSFEELRLRMTKLSAEALERFR